MRNIDSKIINSITKLEWLSRYKSEDEILKQATTLLKLNNQQVRSDRMKRSRGRIDGSKGVTYDYDDTTLLDSYYAGMINDTLDEIRRGHEAYLYSLEQVKDTMKYEPKIEVNVKDGIYYIKLKKENMRRLKVSA